MKTKRKLTLLITCILLFAMTVLPVSAVELPNTATVNDAVVTGTSGTNYFSKITPKLNSLNGLPATASLSSGSCSGDTRSITSVSVYCRVSSGSSPFTLYVTSPSGKTLSTSCGTSSGTYTFSGFRGEYPYGTWIIIIVTNGTVSTVTATLDINYSYQYN